MTVSGFSAVGTNTFVWQRENPAGNGSGSGLSIQNLSAGTYHVTVSSPTGCSATFTSLVSEPRPIEINFTKRDYNCFGETGSINVSVSGGTQPYGYNWGGGIITRNRTDLTAGTYTLTVTDANGCTQSSATIITGPTSGFNLSLSKTDVSCFGAANGSIASEVTGGQIPYSYSWSDGNTNANRSQLTPGTYLLTVTDVQGCIATAQTTISQPVVLAVNITISNPSCPTNGNAPLNNDGAINLTTTGGTAPYQYLWNDNVTTRDRTGLQEGTYNVTITDARGCQLQRTITLTPLSGLPGTPNGINR
jgi:hypothetical protein